MTDRSPFRCVHCGMTSWHPRDAEQHYCGNCHHYCDDQDAPETIGHLADRLPVDVWVDLPEYGIRVKRLGI